MADRWKCGACDSEWIERGVSGWGRWKGGAPRRFTPALHDNPSSRCECGAMRPKGQWTCGACGVLWTPDETEPGWWRGRTKQDRMLSGTAEQAQRCTCGAPRPARPEIADVPDEAPASAQKALQSSSYVVAGEFRDAGYFESREPQVRIVVTASKSMAPYLVYELCQKDNVTVKVEEVP